MSFLGLLIFLLSFAIGVSSTPWAINAEIYPLHVIGTANSLATTCNWVANFTVASVFLESTGSPVGSVLTYVALASFAVCAWIFVYLMIPETAQRDIKEILGLILDK